MNSETAIKVVDVLDGVIDYSLVVMVVTFFTAFFGFWTYYFTRVFAIGAIAVISIVISAMTMALCLCSMALREVLWKRYL